MKALAKAKAYLSASRPFFKWLFFASTVSAGMIFGANAFPPAITWLEGMLLFAFFGQAGIRLINDYFDFELDSAQENDPFKGTRKVLSSEIGRKEALFAGLALHALGTALSYLAFGPFFALMFFLSAAASFLYSCGAFKKRFPLNTVSINFIYGFFPIVAGFSVFSPIALSAVGLASAASRTDFWAFVALCYVLGSASNNLKDITDIEGDRMFGVRNMAVLWGAEKTVLFCSLLVGLVYLAVPVLVILNVFPVRTLLIEALGIIMAFIVFPKAAESGPGTGSPAQLKSIFLACAWHNILFIFLVPVLAVM